MRIDWSISRGERRNARVCIEVAGRRGVSVRCHSDEDAVARSVDGGDQSCDGSCCNSRRLGNRMVLASGWTRVRLDISANVFVRGLDNFRRWVSPVPDEPEDAFRALPKIRPRNRQRANQGEVDEVVAKSNAIVTRPARAAVMPRPADTSEGSAERLNLVLDKISKHGIESLTSEEVRLLEDMSRKLRDS